ncbi:hypothetical protein JYQ62_03550 [Nostoc sp. UHCC 0702]|nr:hypothetical protein JYQ62_03550 [Nostoc sp. UHCC 0702]
MAAVNCETTETTTDANFMTLPTVIWSVTLIQCNLRSLYSWGLGTGDWGLGTGDWGLGEKPFCA